MNKVQPDSLDGTRATVAACIGVCLGLLDQWLPGDSDAVPAWLAGRVKLPALPWLGQRMAADILAWPAKGAPSAPSTSSSSGKAASTCSRQHARPRRGAHHLAGTPLGQLLNDKIR